MKTTKGDLVKYAAKEDRDGLIEGSVKSKFVSNMITTFMPISVGLLSWVPYAVICKILSNGPLNASDQAIFIFSFFAVCGMVLTSCMFMEHSDKLLKVVLAYDVAVEEERKLQGYYDE